MRTAALIALAAALIAVPGTASANWTKHHKSAVENFEVEITGTNLRFQGNVGSVECHTISKALAEVGQTGKVQTLEEAGKPSEVCDAGGGINHCTVTDVVADGLPWTFHAVSSGTISFTTGTITTDLTGFLCPDPDLTPGTLHATAPAGEANTTSTGTLSGTLQGDGPSGAVTVSGELHLLGAVTYGS